MPLPETDAHDLGEAIVRRWASETDLPLDRLERSEHGSVFGYRSEAFAAGAAAEGAATWKIPLQLGRIHLQPVRPGADERLPLRLWWRMVRDPLPWFVLRIQLDDAGQPSAAHLTHIGSSMVRFVFAMRRTFSARGEDTSNEQLLGFTAQPEDSLLAPEGLALRARVMASADDLPAYARDKIRGLHGFEGGWARRRILLTGEPVPTTPAERGALVDLAIGLRSSMSTEEFLAGDEELDASLDGGEPAEPSRVELPFPASLGRTLLTVETEDFEEHLSIEVEVFSPVVLLSDLTSGEVRRRYVSQLLTLTTGGPSGRVFAWNPLPPDPVSLEELDTGARIAELFAAARPRRSLRLTHSAWGLDVVVAVHTRPQSFTRHERDVVAAIRDACRLVCRFGLDADMSVDPRQISADRWRLRTLARILDPATPPREVRVVVDRELSGDGSEAAIVLPLTARVGGVLLTAIVQYSGVARWSAEPRELTIRAGTVRVLETSGDALADASLDELHKEARWLAAQIAEEARHPIVVFAPAQPGAAEVLRRE